tara:strand:- start:234 stop:1325 length:1092 start_codon:yes stop_codon:yes gene_type:complete
MSTDAEILLSEINANKVAIEQKTAEIQAFIGEKKQLIKDLTKLQNDIIPAKGREINELTKIVEKSYSAWNSRIAKAKKDRQNNIDDAQELVDSAYSDKETKKTKYNTTSATANLWSSRYNDGCKWKGSIGGWQGFYAGDYSRFCTHAKRTTHNYNTDAPPYCLVNSERKKRQEYAKAKYTDWTRAKNTAYKDYNDSVTLYNDRITARDNAKSNASVDKARNNKSDIIASEQALSDAKKELANINSSTGQRAKLEGRISFVDAQIDSKNKELLKLEQERTVTEVKYKETISLEAQKLSIIAEKEKEAQAKRDQIAKITEGSIEANLQSGVSGVPSQFMQPKKSNVPIILVIGLLAIGGYAFIKK